MHAMLHFPFDNIFLIFWKDYIKVFFHPISYRDKINVCTMDTKYCVMAVTS